MAILMCNPTTDHDFVHRANELAADGSTPADLQTALRAYYPEAVVRPRGLSTETEMWYVYREGRWIPSRSGQEDTDDRGSAR